MRNTGPRLALTVLAALLALLDGCGNCRTHASVQADVFGDFAKGSATDVAPYLAVAHAIIAHAPRPDTQLPQRAGQRVFITWWSPGHPAVRGTGLGPTLLESVASASEEVAKTASGEGRVLLELVTSVQNGSAEADANGPSHQAGLYGYGAYDEGLKFGWVPPSEIVAEKLIDARDEHPTKLKVKDIDARIAERASVSPHVLNHNMTKVRFKVDQSLEAATPGQPPIRLFQSMPPRATELGPEDLLRATREAADYITRVCEPDGKFVYRYDPVRDKPEKGYDKIRHAGAIYALMDAYEALHVEAWRAAAERAIGYLEHELITSPNGTSLVENEHEEQGKAGGRG